MGTLVRHARKAIPPSVSSQLCPWEAKHRNWGAVKVKSSFDEPRSVSASYPDPPHMQADLPPTTGILDADRWQYPVMLVW